MGVKEPCRTLGDKIVPTEGNLMATKKKAAKKKKH
jgi:hypothetical protein